jgi:hypothetical protein
MFGKEKEKMIFAGTGNSSLNDPYEAGKEAVEKAITKAGKIPQFGLVVYPTQKYGLEEKNLKAFAKGVDEAYKKNNPNIKWIGISSMAAMSEEGFYPDRVVALALDSKYLHFGVGIGRNVLKNPFKAGQEATKAAIADVKMDTYLDPYIHFTALKNLALEKIIKVQPYSLLSLLPGTTRSYLPSDMDVLKGIIDIVGTNVSFFGGTASDHAVFEKTYVMANGEVSNDMCVLVSMVSTLHSGIGVSHGYIPSTKMTMITKVNGNVVLELDNKPAADRYAELVGVSVEDLRKNLIPIIIKNPFGLSDMQGNYWVKTPQTVTKEGGLTFFSPVKETMGLCIMEVDNKKMLTSVKQAVDESLKNIDPSDIDFSFVISCAGRCVFLGKDVVKEHAAIKKIMKGKPFIGFYSYSELARVQSGPIGQHTFTFLVNSFTNKLISN